MTKLVHFNPNMSANDLVEWLDKNGQGVYVRFNGDTVTILDLPLGTALKFLQRWLTKEPTQ